MKLKKAVVTGGSGFIGSHLVKELMARGVEVGIVTRYGSVVKHPRLNDVWGKLAVFEADLRHRDALAMMMTWRPDAVFHLAAYNHVGDSFRQVEECYQINALGSANVMDVVNGNAVLVYVSSSEVYGSQDHVPWDESMIPKPQSPYAITKYAGELHARMLQILKFPVQIVRPFNTFGPYQSTKAVIAEMIVKCLNGVPIKSTLGEQTREFNYVSDIVDGMIKAAECDMVVSGPVNLASGQEVAIADMIKTIHAMTKSSSELNIGAYLYRPNEIWRMCADRTRAKNAFGWEPKVDFVDGLSRTVEWYKANRELVK
jgi:dTDP-glucose 4,6-dehydratase